MSAATTLTGGAGFYPLPGTDFSTGDEAEIARRLDTLAKQLNERIIGISGARSPQHSVAVGGSADDPHTKAQAGDIGVNGATRASAAALTDAQLASVGLYRPFSGAAEINHVQLIKGSGPVDTAKSVVSGTIDAGKSIVSGAQTAVDVTGSVVDFLKDPRRALLYLLLLAGGAALAVTGLVYALGSSPSQAARTAAKGAVIA